MSLHVTAPPVRARLQQAARRQPLTLIAFGVVLYSVGPVLVGASVVSGPVFSFWRLWLGVPILAVATLLHVRAGGRLPGRAGWRWAGLAGVAFGLHQLLFMTAIKLTSVTDVALMSTVAPVVVAVAAVPLFGERTGAPFKAWTALAMVGAGTVVLRASTGPDGDPVGMTLAALNVVAFAAFFLVSKLGRDDVDVLPFLLGTMTVAALTVSVFALATGAPVARIDERDLLLTLVVAAGPGAVGHFVMTWPLRWVAANIPPVVRLAQPVLSAVLAWALLGEAITAAHLGGGALTLAGVAGALLLRPTAASLDGDEDRAEAEGFEPSMGE